MQPRPMRYLIVTLFAAALCAGCSVSEPPPGLGMDVAAARAAHTASTLPDGRIFVAGGCVTDGCATATRDTALVDQEGARAVSGPMLAKPRSSHTATTLSDGRVVLAGGFLGEGAGVTDIVEVFDPADDRLTSVGRLAQPRGGHTAALLPDGQVLVVGGWVASGRYTDITEVIDASSGTVTTVAPMPWAADALEATALADGRVLVTGGQVGRAVATPDAALFDPATGAWEMTAPMDAARLKHFAVLLDDGRVLVGGGTQDDRTLLTSTEVFDPASGSFAPGPELIEGRYKMPGGVIALSEGRALVAAGGRSVEVIDVPRGSSRQVADLQRRASFATVSLLPRGHALVLGGYDDSIDLTTLDLRLAIPNAK